MHPAYTDVSHYRAPYKNAYFAGFGAEAAATPAEPLPGSAPAAPIPDVQAIAVDVGPDGVRVFKPQVAATIQLLLGQSSVVLIGGADSDDVRFEPAVPMDIRENALSWVKRKLGEGKSVLAGSTAGLTAVLAPPGGADKLLKAVKGTAGEVQSAGPQALPFYAVLARPSPAELAKAAQGKSIFASMTPLSIGIVTVAVIGGLYLYSKKKGRRAA
jgi:hypothetical protein